MFASWLSTMRLSFVTVVPNLLQTGSTITVMQNPPDLEH